ncbi:MAG: HD domain-containing phosphohydrolase, partial [Cyanobacteriota bacterium]
VHSVTPYTVYDKKGNILCYKGVALTPNLVSLLSLNELYKLDIQHNKETTEEQQENLIVSRISQQTTNYIVDITEEFLKAAEKGTLPVIKSCYDARDRIIEEVKEHINLINHIGELRISLDNYSISHGINVATISTAIAFKMNFSKDEIKEISLGALLHDIGKTRIPKQILEKPEKLSLKEFEVIKLHAPLGYKIIKDEYKMTDNIALAALDHQERYDGSGYNRKLKGDSIYRYAQIISLADVYDAAVSEKAYAPSKTSRQVVKELLKNSTQFNPRILYTLVHMIDYNTGGLKEKIPV